MAPGLNMLIPVLYSPPAPLLSVPPLLCHRDSSHHPSLLSAQLHGAARYSSPTLHKHDLFFSTFRRPCWGQSFRPGFCRPPEHWTCHHVPWHLRPRRHGSHLCACPRDQNDTATGSYDCNINKEDYTISSSFISHVISPEDYNPNLSFKQWRPRAHHDYANVVVP